MSQRLYPFVDEASDVASYTGGLSTMVDSDGLIKWAPHNLFIDSEFTNSANYTNASSSLGLLFNQPDPDGGAGAVLAQAGASDRPRFQFNNMPAPNPGETGTIKVWMRSNLGTVTTPSFVYGGRFAGTVTPFTIGETWTLVTYTDWAANTTTALCQFRTDAPGDEVYYYQPHLYRSDLGGMVDNPATGNSYVPTTGTAQYLPRIGHHEYNGTTWVNKGLLVEGAGENLLLNSGTLSTQSVTVTAVPHTLHFTGTGTVTLSGAATGSLVGTGTGEENRVSLTFTPTAGTLTLTVSGTVTNAQLEVGEQTSYIPTSGTTVTRSAESVTFAPSAFDSVGHTMTIPAAKITGTHTNFPVYLDLAQMPSQFWDDVRAGDGTADSLRVFALNAGNYVEKPREIVSADSTIGSESGEVHFLTDTVAGQDATVVLYADGSQADYGVTQAFGRNAVWAEYDFVWHGQALEDATGTWVLEANGGVVVGAADYGMGSATTFDGVDDFIRTTANFTPITGDDPVTASINVNFADQPATNTASGERFVQFGRGGYFRDNGGAFQFVVESSFNTSPYASLGIQAKYVAEGADQSVTRKYGAGVLLASGTASRATSNNAPLSVGSSDSGSNNAQITVDEIRYSRTAQSANWITDEYNNQSDPASFYSIAANDAGGATEVSPTGLTSSTTLGSPTLTVEPVNLSPTGITATTTFESPVVTAGEVLLVPSDVSTTTDLGTPTVTQTTITELGVLTAGQSLTAYYSGNKWHVINLN